MPFLMLATLLALPLLGASTLQALDVAGGVPVPTTLPDSSAAGKSNNASYPADEADAGANTSSNSIVIDDRGELSSGLVGLANETHQVVLKDSDGNTAGTVDEIGVPIQGEYGEFSTYTLLRASSSPSDGDVGYVTGTGIAGPFVFDSSETATDDGGIYLAPDDNTKGRWVRRYDGPISVKWFGAAGNGTTDDTIAINSAMSAAPVGGQIYFPVGVYMVSAITNSKRLNFKGDGWRTSVRAPFADERWTTANVQGSVIKISVTKGNPFQWGGKQSSPFHFGGKCEDIFVLGPGTGTSVGISLKDVVSATFINVGIANFSVGMDWNFVEDTAFYGLKIWGCQTGLTSNIRGNNENTLIGYEFNRCDTAISASYGKQNRFYGGLIQASTNDVWVFDTSGGGALESWKFADVWIENTDDTKNDLLTIKGGSQEMMTFEGVRLSNVSGFNISGGPKNRSLVLRDWRNHTGILAITIPKNISNARLENMLGFTITDDSRQAYFNESGSFTGTLTGVSGSATGSVGYLRTGRQVVLDIPDIVDTSNASEMTITGMHTNIIPLNDTQWFPVRVKNNGTTVLGIVRVTASGLLQFRTDVTGATFARSGVKGVLGSTITYSLE